MASQFSPYTSNVKLTDTPVVNLDNINFSSNVTNNTTLAFNGVTNVAPTVANSAQNQGGSSFGGKKAPSPTKRSISSIKKSLLHPALTSHFECYFPPPPPICDGFIKQVVRIPSIQDLLLISCSDATLPGSQFATHDLNNDVMGVSQKHAYRRMYDDRADFTFYVTMDPSHGYSQIRYFERWMQFIGGEQQADEVAGNVYFPYRMKFPNDYKTQIYITKFERNTQAKGVSGPQKITYSFFNAFPVAIASMPVSYESSQLLKVTVSFVYDRYVMGNVAQSSASSNGSSTTPTVPTVPNLPGLSQNPLSTGSISDLRNSSYANGEIYQFNTAQIKGIGVVR